MKKLLTIEPSWSCEIRKIDEGYIVQTLEELQGSDKPVYRTHEEYCEGLQQVFWFIADHFGEYKVQIKVTDKDEDGYTENAA